MSSNLLNTYNELTCVIKLANLFIAIHFKENLAPCILESSRNIITFISKYPETDKVIAENASKAFAALHQIPYTGLKSLEKPLMTIIKYDQKWIPAILHTESMSPLKKFSFYSKYEAGNLASAMALSHNINYAPAIGRLFTISF